MTCFRLKDLLLIQFRFFWDFMEADMVMHGVWSSAEILSLITVEFETSLMLLGVIQDT